MRRAWVRWAGLDTVPHGWLGKGASSAGGVYPGLVLWGSTRSGTVGLPMARRGLVRSDATGFPGGMEPAWHGLAHPGRSRFAWKGVQWFGMSVVWLTRARCTRSGQAGSCAACCWFGYPKARQVLVGQRWKGQACSGYLWSVSVWSRSVVMGQGAVCPGPNRGVVRCGVAPRGWSGWARFRPVRLGSPGCDKAGWCESGNVWQDSPRMVRTRRGWLWHGSVRCERTGEAPLNGARSGSVWSGALGEVRCGTVCLP